MKRGPSDQLSSVNGAAAVTTGGAEVTALNAHALAAMTVGGIDNEAKKAKLDVSGVGCPIAVPTSGGVPLLSAVSSVGASSSMTNGGAVPPMASVSGNGGASTSTTVYGRPSRVVHLRNLPSDMTDVELIHMCIPFGKITNFLLLKGKNQAFVEFEDETGAMSLVGVANSCPIVLRNRTIFCQFSNHQQLKTDNKNAFNAASLNSAPTTVPMMMNGGGGDVVGGGALPPSVGGGAHIGNPSAVQQQPNAVLRVIIENMLYPVTLDVLYSIFVRFGKVLRIITFSKNNTFQALIQISEASAAQLAKQTLDGQNVYNGCCTLRIDYSKLATLNVKYNNDKSRDYTNPNLPSGELTLEQQLGLASAAAGFATPASLAGLAALQNPFNAVSAQGGGGGGGYPMCPSTAAQTAQFQQALAAAAGLGPSLSQQQQQQAITLQNMANQAAVQQAFALNQQLGLASPTALGGGHQHHHHAASAPSPALRAAASGIVVPQLGLLQLPPVVLVSNLDENKVTPDALFTLFGVYGDVQRVKVLFNKKDNALIQYAEPAQAQLAVQHLDKVKVWGKQIRVAVSKHNNVQMPKEGQPDAGLTKDYSQSPLHRFKKPGSKNYMNIYPPSATLHLSNIPPNITEQFLVDAFVDSAFPCVAFKFFPKDKKMALMQLETVDLAIEALIVMHNFKLAENAHLRVSFSKSGITPTIIEKAKDVLE